MARMSLTGPFAYRMVSRNLPIGKHSPTAAGSNAMRSRTNTRDRILDVATAQFAQRGVHGVSLDQIAKELGISKQAVLHHYASKEKLYGEVLAAIAAKYEAILADPQVESLDPQARIIAVFEALYQSDSAAVQRGRLVLRELLDVGSRAKTARTWPLRSFLDQLLALGRSVPAWAEHSDEQIFVTLYQFIGSVSYFIVSTETLAGMYGGARLRALKQVFADQLAQQIKAAVQA